VISVGSCHQDPANSLRSGRVTGQSRTSTSSTGRLGNTVDDENSVHPVGPGLGREDGFDVVVRGYNKRQVDEVVGRLRDQISGLEERLSVALDAAERARRELLQAQEVVRQSATKEPISPKPAHEQVSERLSQILRLAAEEADQSRAKAEDEIDQQRRRAEEESGSLVTSARAEAEHIVTSTRQTADRELASSREEARRLLDSAQTESKRTLSEAQTRAERLLAEAENRASAVNDVAGRRLEIISGSHADAVRRLSSIKELIAGVLAEEAAAGSVMAAVDNAAPPSATKHVSDSQVKAAAVTTQLPISALPATSRVLDLDAAALRTESATPVAGPPQVSSMPPTPSAASAAVSPAGAPAVVDEGGTIVLPQQNAADSDGEHDDGVDSFGSLFLPQR
jgi:hypothetical protein